MFGKSFLTAMNSKSKAYFIYFPLRGRVYGRSYMEICMKVGVRPLAIIPYKDGNGVERVHILYK